MWRRGSSVYAAEIFLPSSHFFKVIRGSSPMSNSRPEKSLFVNICFIVSFIHTYTVYAYAYYTCVYTNTYLYQFLIFSISYADINAFACMYIEKGRY